MKSYVEPTRNDLEIEKTLYRRLAWGLYTIAFACLAIAVIFTFATVRETATIPQSQWIKLCVIGAKTAFVLALTFACSRYTFHLGSSFMNEALRSADRIHAIRFGELYLNVYGDKAEWSQLKEAFQDWNIDRTSPFASMNADSYDPKVLEKFADLAKAAIERGK